MSQNQKEFLGVSLSDVMVNAIVSIMEVSASNLGHPCHWAVEMGMQFILELRKGRQSGMMLTSLWCAIKSRKILTQTPYH